MLYKCMLQGENAARSFLKYPTSNLTYKRTVCRIVEKFRMTGSVMDINKIRNCIFLD